MKLVALVLMAAAGTVAVIWIPLETRRLRRGWMPKRYAGGHAEYVAAYRRQLARMGCLFIPIGAVSLAFVVLSPAMSGGDYAHNAVMGTGFGAIGVVCLICRRSLNSVSNATTQGHPR